MGENVERAKRKLRTTSNLPVSTRYLRAAASPEINREAQDELGAVKGPMVYNSRRGLNAQEQPR